MHVRLPRRRRDERGAAAVVIAMSMTLMLVAAALVIDFGIIRLDRQTMKSVADDAVLSGIAGGDGGTGQVYTYRAVCAALRSLQATSNLSGLPDADCANLAANSNVTCSADASTHLNYDQTISHNGVDYHVKIAVPYVLNADGWSVETMQSLAGDQSTAGGCDQMAVQIFEARAPGLGSLASKGDMQFGVRSAARVIVNSDLNLSPALLITEDHACSALTIGAAGGGSGTGIRVYGIGSTPGSIHLDSDASGADCGNGSNQQLIQGKQSDGIIAYGSVSPTGTSGVISAYAISRNVAAGIVSDNVQYVYGTPSVSGVGAIKNPVVGRRKVTRGPVDTRYRLGVRAAITAANPLWTAGSGSWNKVVNNCSPNASQLASVATDRLYIKCPSGAISFPTSQTPIGAGEIYFGGYFKKGVLTMPNATKIYIEGDSATNNPQPAISLGNSDAFCVRGDCGTTSSSTCSTSATNNPASRALMFVKNGDVTANGGVLRLCNTTAILLGNDPVNGCVPGVDGTAPTASPCPGGTLGSTKISVGGTSGIFDWTAPNQYAADIPSTDTPAAWRDRFEDLAMWSETAATDNQPYNFAGNGAMQTRGVFMMPNGPMNVTGNGTQNLFNAQYVARKFTLSGGGTLGLTTDPKNAVTIPNYSYVLIR